MFEYEQDLQSIESATSWNRSEDWSPDLLKEPGESIWQSYNTQYLIPISLDDMTVFTLHSITHSHTQFLYTCNFIYISQNQLTSARSSLVNLPSDSRAGEGQLSVLALQALQLGPQLVPFILTVLKVTQQWRVTEESWFLPELLVINAEAVPRLLRPVQNVSFLQTNISELLRVSIKTGPQKRQFYFRNDELRV